MAIKRDSEKYPFLNGGWIDKFATSLLSKEAQLSAEKPVDPSVPASTPVPSQTPQSELDNWISLGIQFLSNPQKSGLSTVDAVLNHFAHDPVYGPAFNKLNKIRDLPTIKNAIESNAISWGQSNSNLSNVKNSFLSYVQQNAIQDLNVDILDKFLDSFNGSSGAGLKNSLSVQQKMDILLDPQFQNYKKRFNIDDLKKIVDAWIASGENKNSIEQYLSKVNVQPDQLQDIALYIDQVIMMNSLDEKTRSIVNLAYDSMIKKKSIEYGKSSEALLNEFFLTSNTDVVTRNNVEKTIINKFESRMNELRKIATEIVASSARQSVGSSDLLSKYVFQIPEESQIVSQIISENQNMSGSYDKAAFNDYFSKIKDIISGPDVSQKMSAIRSQVEAYFAANPDDAKKKVYLETIGSIERSIQSFGSVVERLKTAKSKALVKVSGILDFFTKKTDISGEDALKNDIANVIGTINNSLQDFGMVKSIVNRPNTPDNIKQLMNSLSVEAENMDKVAVYAAENLGIPNLSTNNLKSILNNTRQSISSGHSQVDPTTGNPQSGGANAHSVLQQLSQGAPALQSGNPMSNGGGQPAQGVQMSPNQLLDQMDYLSKYMYPQIYPQISIHIAEIKKLFSSAPSGTEAQGAKNPTTASSKKWIDVS